MKLSDRAMLTHLHQGCWSGSKHDKQVTEDTATAHHADTKEAGRYSKQIIPRKYLGKLFSTMRVSRSTHRFLTLPWDDSGTRILTAQGYMHYAEQMRLHRLTVEAATKEFIKNYPDYINGAKVILGKMFNPEDYPQGGELTGKFYIDVEITQIPEAADFRTKLADNTVKAITKDIERRTNARIEAAVQDVFKRVVDVTGKMSAKLKEFDPGDATYKADGLFRDSLVYNVLELADLLPSLNITQDQRLDDLSKQLKDDLVAYSPEILRVDAKKRKETADKAAKLFKKVSQYLA